MRATRWSIRRGRPPRLATSLLAALATCVAILTAPRPLAADAVIDLAGTWKFKGDWEENGQLQGWQNADFDDSTWRDLEVPGPWEPQGITTDNPRWHGITPGDSYNGYAWYRRHITIPADWAEAEVALRIGAIDDMDWTYLNGKLIGSTTGDKTYDRERIYEIPADLLKAGADNVIAIRVCDTGGDGGITLGPVELARIEKPPISEEAPEAEPSRYYRESRGEIVKAGSSVVVPGHVKVNGNVVAIGGPVYVEGYVTGDTVAVGGSVRVRRGGRVDGDVVAIGGRLIRDPGAVTNGDVVELTFFPWSAFERWVHRPMFGWLAWWPLTGGLAMVGAFLRRVILWSILALILALVLPKRLAVMARALPLYPGWVALHGVLGAVLTPAAASLLVMIAVFTCLVLIVTFVGIALIPAVAVLLVFGILGFGLLLVLGLGGVWASIGQAVGTNVGKAEMSLLPASIVGAVLTAGACSIPGIGKLLLITLLIFAYGLALMTGMGASPEWSHRRLHIGRRPEPAPSPPPPAT